MIELILGVAQTIAVLGIAGTVIGFFWMVIFGGKKK